MKAKLVSVVIKALEAVNPRLQQWLQQGLSPDECSPRNIVDYCRSLLMQYRELYKKNIKDNWHLISDFQAEQEAQCEKMAMEMNVLH